MAKVADLQIEGNRCYYKLNGCSDEEYVDIINYKSWTYKSWKYGIEKKYFCWSYINRPDLRIIWSYIGYAPILIRFLQSLNFLINGKELFKSREIVIGNTLYKPWDFQEIAILTWIQQGCSGVIKMPTGSGKTFSACSIISRMKLRTIICVHTNDLLINAWFNTLVEQFGESIRSQIGIVGGKLTVKDRKSMRILSSTSYEDNIKQDIIIATSQSLLNKLNKLVNEKFGLIVFDEVHHAPAEQFNKVVSAIRAPYRLGLSATLLRSDGMSPMIWGLLGDIVYRIGIKELVNKNVLVEPSFNTIIIQDNTVQHKIATCGLSKLDLSRYVKGMSASSVVKRNYILQLTKNLCSSGKRFIMYTDFVMETDFDNPSEINDIHVFTRDNYVKSLNELGVRAIGVSSDMSGGERENVFNMLENGKIDGLVFGKLGSEGVNIPKVDSVILCNSTKSTILFPQRVGRALRVVKNDKTKRNAYIYELLLNVPLEIKWSNYNFFEYKIEGYEKKIINIQ